MKVQNLTLIFIIIILPILLILSLYISNGLKTIEYQTLYDDGLVSATSDALYAFELNTANDELSDNPEIKRDILKASIKMFEKSLCNTCNISSYNTDEIEEYIPAIVYGMYDGFYMYAPSYNSNTGKYEHSLKNYVYYSETIEGAGKDGTDIIVTYSLDNYITVCGNFGNGYEIKKGYLSVINASEVDEIQGEKYNGVSIVPELIDGQENTDGQKYYEKAFKFTYWFLNTAKMNNITCNGINYFDISASNDPEDPNSAFNQHKRQIIKNKIEGVLNSTITAYSKRTWGQEYKMPKLSDEDWEKIYSDISMITFFQGKQIGFTKYNGYTVVNSTNGTEYVNPSLMYFIDEDEKYHDIRCKKIEELSNIIVYEKSELNGYRIGSFEKKKNEELDENGNTVTTYKYDHDELACYECVNGMLSTNQSVYKYITDENTDSDIKSAYWTSLGRERYNSSNDVSWIELKVNIAFHLNEGTYEGGDNLLAEREYSYGENININLENTKSTVKKDGFRFKGWSISTTVPSLIWEINEIATTSKTYYAIWAELYEIEFDLNGGNGINVNAYKKSYEYGDNIEFPDRKPEKEGYKFKGWAKDNPNAETGVTEASCDGNATYYAVWEKIEYTVEFYENKPNGDNNKIESFTQKASIDNNFKVVLPNMDTEVEGYNFKGWNISRNATSGQAAGTEVEVESDLTYYAIWKEKTYTVTYNANGGTEEPSSQTKKHGVDLKLRETIPTKTGYTFNGWGTTSAATEPSYKPGDKYTLNANITLYAIWKINTYTVTYNANGGSGQPGSQIKKYGEDLTLSTTEPTRTGYTFNGWGTTSAATEPSYKPGDKYTLNANITLYAIWGKNTYIVTYNANGGSGQPSSQTKKHGENLTLRNTVPTRAGYDFQGWATSSSARTAEYSAGGTYSEDRSVTLYAVWRISQLKIGVKPSFYYNSGEEKLSVKVKYKIYNCPYESFSVQVGDSTFSTTEFEMVWTGEFKKRKTFLGSAFLQEAVRLNNSGSIKIYNSKSSDESIKANCGNFGACFFTLAGNGEWWLIDNESNTLCIVEDSGNNKWLDYGSYIELVIDV